MPKEPPTVIPCEVVWHNLRRALPPYDKCFTPVGIDYVALPELIKLLSPDRLMTIDRAKTGVFMYVPQIDLRKRYEMRLWGGVKVWMWHVAYDYIVDPMILDQQNPKLFALSIWRDVINRPVELK